jgi:coproporphyrinogen III oxidase-like Fe-S oxidoreductase
MIAAAQKIRNCGLFLSVTILLGIGGKNLSLEHARHTGSVVTEMSPNQIAALSVIPLPNTALFELIQNGKFTLPDKTELLMELKTIIEHIKLDRVQFYANHASNYLPLAGRLQKDKETLLSRIDSAITGATQLVPEHLRFL